MTLKEKLRTAYGTFVWKDGVATDLSLEDDIWPTTNASLLQLGYAHNYGLRQDQDPFPYRLQATQGIINALIPAAAAIPFLAKIKPTANVDRIFSVFSAASSSMIHDGTWAIISQDPTLSEWVRRMPFPVPLRSVGDIQPTMTTEDLEEAVDDNETESRKQLLVLQQAMLYFMSKQATTAAVDDDGQEAGSD